jgi:hypothetical protein
VKRQELLAGTTFLVRMPCEACACCMSVSIVVSVTVWEVAGLADSVSSLSTCSVSPDRMPSVFSEQLSSATFITLGGKPCNENKENQKITSIMTYVTSKPDW